MSQDAWEVIIAPEFFQMGRLRRRSRTWKAARKRVRFGPVACWLGCLTCKGQQLHLGPNPPGSSFSG